jgi:hypothetical protein
MKDVDKALTVDVRNGLPDELLELLRKFPRDQWTNDARCMDWPKAGSSGTICFTNSRC